MGTRSSLHSSLSRLFVSCLALVAGPVVGQDVFSSAPPSKGKGRPDCPPFESLIHDGLTKFVDLEVTTEGDALVSFWLPQYAFAGFVHDPAVGLDRVHIVSAGELSTCRFAPFGTAGEGCSAANFFGPLSASCGFPLSGTPGGTMTDGHTGDADAPMMHPHPPIDTTPYYSPQTPNGAGGARAMATRATMTGQTTYNGTHAGQWRFEGMAANAFAYKQNGINRALVKHASGSTVEFEPGVKLPTGETLYRATKVVDTQGRAMQRQFDALGRLFAITYPTGASEHWSWDESSVPGFSRITVTYDIDQDGTADEPGPEFEARWGMEFQQRNGLTRPFSDIPPTRIFYPATPYVTAPSQAELFNTTPQTAYHVVEIAYQDLALPGLPSIPRPYAVNESRHATLFGSIGALPPHIGKVEYAALNGRMRVTEFADRHGAQTTFAYTQFSGPQSEWVAEVVTTDPRGTGRITYLDSEGRTSRIKVQPSPSTLPRQADPYFSSLGLSEPASLEWEFVYASSGGCGCGKPIEIR